MSTPPAAIATQYLDRPDGRIAYDVQGAGPLVVLVPGMAELRSSYRHLTPLLIEAGFTVATTDLRGHGDSDTTFASYGDVDTAGDIAALLEVLGRPAVVVGNSLAAGSAVIVAADHPDRVSGLVLVGAFVRNPRTNALLRGVFRAMTARVWVATMWKAYMPTLYAGAKPVDFAEYRAAVTSGLQRPGYGAAFSRTARETDHAPAEAKLPDVAAPSLVVMGERDPDFSDPAAEARWIGDRLGAEVVMVADAGHYPQAQQPARTAEAVVAFVRSIGDRA